MKRLTFVRHGIPLLTFCSGILLTIVIVFATTSDTLDMTEVGTSLRDTDTPYTFVKPLLACDVGGTLESTTLTGLKNILTGIVDEAKNNGTVEEASVYVRLLDSGEWTAVNIDANYAPASLMKVPVLIAYLHQSEYDPDLLTRTITVAEDPAPGTAQDITPSASVEVGKTYTVEELLHLMVAYSDNRALNVLMQHVDITTLEEVLEDLGVPFPEDMGGYTINPRLYSRFFRVLYNATYLWPAKSEDALALLAKSDFDAGLVRGVHTGPKVAHKFGEAQALLADGTEGHELHDCGIVYTDSPYTICVMTRGANVDALTNLIATISTAVYDAVTQE